MRGFKMIAGLAVLLGAGMPLAQADTLSVVKEHGAVQCGVTTGFAGFSAPDAKGEWKGLDVDMCRAVAAAVLGDASKVKIVPLNAQQRFTALQSGEIDLLARNTTVTQSRDTALGAVHAAINFYDGQGFMVPKSLGITSARDLNGATVCMQTGTSNEQNMADWARAHNVQYKPGAASLFHDTAIFNTAGVHASWVVSPQWRLAAAYSYTAASKANGITDAATYHQVSLAQVYSLSKRTSLYALEAWQHANGKSLSANAASIINAGPAVGDSQNSTPSATSSQVVGMLGIRVDF